MVPARKREMSDVTELPTTADQDWRARCRIEDVTKQAWRGKFGWILDEYKLLNEELKELRRKRPYKGHVAEVEDARILTPFPDTSAHVVGWLSGRREFLLEKYGPYPYTSASRPPLLPPRTELE